MRFRGLIVLAAAVTVCARSSGVRAGGCAAAARDGRAGLRHHPRPTGRDARHADRPRPYDINVRDLSTEHNFHIHRAGRQPAHSGGDDGHRDLGPSRSRTAATRSSATRTPPRCAGRSRWVLRRRGRRRRSRWGPSCWRPWGRRRHDLAEERERCGVEDPQGRCLLDHRARPLEAPQLPPRRQGSQSPDRRSIGMGTLTWKVQLFCRDAPFSPTRAPRLSRAR